MTDIHVLGRGEPTAQGDHVRNEQSANFGGFVRFRRRGESFRSSSSTRCGREDSLTVQPTANLKPLRYSLFKRLVDRQNGSRDGYSGCPEYANPEPTPYIKGLVAWFVRQAAIERECMARDTAPWRQALAKMDVDIQAALDASAIERRRDPEVQAWRQQCNHQTKQQLEEAIKNRDEQFANRLNQLAAHTWLRIETYWGRLTQVHLEGELMNEWINKWRPTQLAEPLQKLMELSEPNKHDQPSEFADLSEND